MESKVTRLAASSTASCSSGSTCAEISIKVMGELRERDKRTGAGCIEKGF